MSSSFEVKKQPSKHKRGRGEWRRRSAVCSAWGGSYPIFIRSAIEGLNVVGLAPNLVSLFLTLSTSIWSVWMEIG